MKDQHSEHDERSRVFTPSKKRPKRRGRRSARIGSSRQQRDRLLDQRGRRLLAFTTHYTARLLGCPVGAVLKVVRAGLVPVLVLREQRHTSSNDPVGEQLDYTLGEFVPLPERS
jgi:hypothetical protein